MDSPNDQVYETMHLELGNHCNVLSVSLVINIHVTRPESYKVQYSVSFCLYFGLHQLLGNMSGSLALALTQQCCGGAYIHIYSTVYSIYTPARQSDQTKHRLKMLLLIRVLISQPEQKQNIYLTK